MHGRESLRLGRERKPKQKDRRPQVGVVDASPVGTHLHSVDGVLDVELVEREDDVPDDDPRVPKADIWVHLEGGVR